MLLENDGGDRKNERKYMDEIRGGMNQLPTHYNQSTIYNGKSNDQQLKLIIHRVRQARHGMQGRGGPDPNRRLTPLLDLP